MDLVALRVSVKLRCSPVSNLRMTVAEGRRRPRLEPRSRRAEPSHA